jgi:hypothetical protein
MRVRWGVWVWVLPWVLGVTAVVVVRAIGVALLNTRLGVDWDYFYTYTFSLVQLFHPGLAAVDGIPLTTIYPEYVLSAPLAWVARGIGAGVYGYVTGDFVFNLAFDAVALMQLAGELGMDRRLGLIALFATAPSLIATFNGAERGLMVGFTALVLILMHRLRGVEARQLRSVKLLTSILLFTGGLAFTFPYTVFFNTLMLFLAIVIALIAYRRIEWGWLTLLIGLVLFSGVRYVALAHVSTLPVNVFGDAVAFSERWGFAIQNPIGLVNVYLPGDYNIPTHMAWLPIIFAGSLLFWLLVLIQAPALIDPPALAMLLLITLLPYPYLIGTLDYHVPFLMHFTAFHTLIRFHNFAAPLILLMLQYVNVDRSQVVFKWVVLAGLILISVLVLYSDVHPAPLGVQVNRLSLGVPLNGVFIADSPELAFSGYYPPVWLRFYYPPNAAFPYVGNWSMFTTLARLLGATAVVYIHSNGTVQWVMNISNPCPPIRNVTNLVYLAGNRLTGNATDCPGVVTPISLALTNPVGALIARYALLHSNATFFLLPGSGTYIPVRCTPLRGYLTGVNAEVCGLIEDSPGVVVSYEGGYLVAWGVFPRLPNSSLVMLGTVGVLPSHRVSELINAYMVFTAVAFIAPLLIALGVYVSGYSGYSCLRGTTRQCTH